MTSVARGVVTRFGRGTVRTGTAKFDFGPTSWAPGSPARWPRRREEVEVVFNHEGHVLVVRAIPG